MCKISGCVWCDPLHRNRLCRYTQYWWNIFGIVMNHYHVPSLAILVSAVLVLSCGQTHTHRESQTQMIVILTVVATVVSASVNIMIRLSYKLSGSVNWGTFSFRKAANDDHALNHTARCIMSRATVSRLLSVTMLHTTIRNSARHFWVG